jgi:hypothetical protein
MTNTIKTSETRGPGGAVKRPGDLRVSGSTLLDAMASPSPSELFAALTDLVAEGRVRVSEACDVYARAGQRRRTREAAGTTVDSARAAVLEAANGMVVHYINSVGQARTGKSEAEGIRAHQDFSDKLDLLIEVCRRQAPIAVRPPSQWSSRSMARLRADLAK